MNSALSSGSVPAASTVDWQPGSCRGAPRRLNGFLNVLECDADECAGYSDAFERLRSGALQAVVVHAVYPQAVLDDAVARLERHDPDFLQTWFPEKFRAWFYGRNINLASPTLAGYFEEAKRFQEQLAGLFPAPGLALRVGALLAQLDNGRPFLAAPGPLAPQRYMFTTLRAHLEGGYIPPHFDNEQALRPSYRHLQGVVEAHMTSFVLALTQAESGGTLEVFDLKVDPRDARMISDDSVASKPDVSALASVGFRLPGGAMIVLDSGRYLHRLTPVQGSRKRWTACSFMALSRGRDAMYCWG